VQDFLFSRPSPTPMFNDLVRNNHHRGHGDRSMTAACRLNENSCAYWDQNSRAPQLHSRRIRQTDSRLETAGEHLTKSITASRPDWAVQRTNRFEARE
jgi:hypothetical protein